MWVSVRKICHFIPYVSLKTEGFSFEEFFVMYFVFVLYFVLPNQIEIMAAGKELKFKKMSTTSNQTIKFYT
jgi:hypothetical protein